MIRGVGRAMGARHHSFRETIVLPRPPSQFRRRGREMCGAPRPRPLALRFEPLARAAAAAAARSSTRALRRGVRLCDLNLDRAAADARGRDDVSDKDRVSQPLTSNGRLPPHLPPMLEAAINPVAAYVSALGDR